MNIVQTVIKNGQIYALAIEDTGEDFYIRLESLHTPTILDSLLASGWELHGLPYDIRMGATTLDHLPSVKYEDAGISEAMEQEMMDMMWQRYKEVDLKAKLVKTPVNYIQFSNSTNQIKTREELVKFLTNTVGTDVDLDIPTAYLPLNSFVSQAALFTPDEYFSDENAEIRNLIEQRRTLSFKNFNRLVDFMIAATGLEETYTAKDLVDKYFSWGLCGVKFDAYDRRKSMTNMILGAPLRHSADAEEMPHVRMRVLSYVTASGDIHRDVNTSSQNWKPAVSQLNLDSIRREAFEAGYEYVSPLFLESVAEEEVTSITGKGLVVEYTDTRLAITHNDYTHTLPTIRVRRLDNVFKYLPAHLWNVKSEEGRKEVYDEFFMHALCRELLSKTTVRTSLSSYKALQTVGAGPMSAFKYMIGRNDHLRDFMKETRDGEGALIVRIEEYLKGNMPSGLAYAQDVENLVEGIFDGSVNVDAVGDGQSADNMTGYDSIYQVIYVAYKLLGVDLETVYKVLSEVTPDTKYLDFKGADRSIRLKISRRDSKLIGFTADRNRYRQEQASQAKEWHWVSEVYRELGSEGAKHHVAVKLLTFYRDKKSAAVENYILDIINTAIADNVPYKDQASFKDFIYVITANALYEAGLKGTITLPPALGGNTINLGDQVRDNIASHFDVEYESTLGISETTIDPEGTFYRYCVNAIVMPKFVMPNKNFKIVELPFLPFWLNTAGRDADMNYFWSQGLIPTPDYRGMSNYYRNKAVLRGRSDWTDDKTSLIWYFTEAEHFKQYYPTDKELVAAPHPVDAAYPALLEKDIDDLELDPRKDPAKVGKPHLWKLGTRDIITKESMLAKHQELRDLFDDSIKLPEPKTGFSRFEGLDSEDFYFLRSLDQLPAVPNFQSKVPLLAVYSKTTACLANDAKQDITLSDVESLNEEAYAVTHIRGRKYLLGDIRGNLWEANV